MIADLSSISIARSVSNSPTNITSCFGDSCSDVSSGVLASQSLVCFGADTQLRTYQASLDLSVSQDESCVNVSVRVTPGRVFTRAAVSPLALSFLPTNYNLVGNNSFAVVTNDKSVTVGQIQSDLIQVEYQRYSTANVTLTLHICMLLDETMGVEGEYDVFDVGEVLAGNVIRPLGFANTSIIPFEDEIAPKICFQNAIILHNSTTSLILVQRKYDYESVMPYTQTEQSIVIASGVLFCSGSLLVLGLSFFVPFNVAVFTAAMQCFALLSVRGVYFILLAHGEISVGGLVDFALIEIPRFIYIGIFLEIILVAYWLFFLSEEVSNLMLSVVIVLAISANWIIFSVFMIWIAFSDVTSLAPKSCNCQISDPISQYDPVRYIRIGYTSVVLVISICVTVVTIFYGSRHVKGRNSTVYFLVVGLSLGLLFGMSFWVNLVTHILDGNHLEMHHRSWLIPKKKELDGRSSIAHS